MLLRGRIFMGIFTEMTHKHEINLGKVSNNCCIAKYRMNTYLHLNGNKLYDMVLLQVNHVEEVFYYYCVSNG